MPEDTGYNALPQVVSMGTMIFDPVWAEQVHVSGFCELLHVIRGTVELELGERRYRARPGDLLLVPQGQKHRDAFDLGEGLEVFMVTFTWEAAESYFALVTNDRLLALPERRKAEIVRDLERLRHDSRGDSEADRLLARARVATVLLALLREAEGPAVPQGEAHRRQRALMLEARQYLAEHYTHPISLEEIAQALGISSFYLSHIFSQESEFSLFAYLTALRMEKAWDLLQTGKLNVSEVAAAVGYESANYFSKVFRKHFGCSPSAARS